MSVSRAIVSAIFLLAFSFYILPFAAGAITTEEREAQIQNILAQIAVLQAKIKEIQAASAATPALGSQKNLPCLSLARTRKLGSRGDDVKELQRFLVQAGALSKGNATGYFGVLTEAAVKIWQAKQNIVSSGGAASGFGVVGPKTRAAILAACRRVQEKKSSAVCPPTFPPPEPLGCAGAWAKAYDANHCLTGYQCVLLSSATSSLLGSLNPAPSSEPRPAPSIVVSAPWIGVAVTGGNTLKISWQSINVLPRETVTLSLIDAQGNNLGVLARGVAPSGSYLWHVPQEDADCAPGESAFSCIEKLSRCEGGDSLCSVPSGTYTILAALTSFIATTSPPFQIAGSMLSSLVQAVVGAPADLSLASDTFSTSTAVGAASKNTCMHDSQPFPEGATLSVPCGASNCPSSSSGYITGECKSGLWCIPFTTYCASSFALIDVSVYEGGGAAPIGNNTGGLNCPLVGWRVYLDCAVLPACKTGWNICTGGGWTYDSDQSVRL